VAVNLLDFLYDTNDVFATKAQNLVRCWRVGITNCLTETDLVVYTMYAKLLSTDLTDYNITSEEVINVMNSIVNIFNITNVSIDNSTTINYITNSTINEIYVTNIINQIPTYTTTYTGVGAFTITVVHGLGKYNPTVIVTDTSTGSRIRVEVGIVETDNNTVVLSFSSDSSGDITIM